MGNKPFVWCEAVRQRWSDSKVDQTRLAICCHGLQPLPTGLRVKSLLPPLLPLADVEASAVLVDLPAPGHRQRKKGMVDIDNQCVLGYWLQYHQKSHHYFTLKINLGQIDYTAKQWGVQTLTYLMTTRIFSYVSLRSCFNHMQLKSTWLSHRANTVAVYWN